MSRSITPGRGPACGRPVAGACAPFRVQLSSVAERRMGNKLRVVVLGLGRMGRNHVRLVSESPNFELAAVLDVGNIAQPPHVPFLRDVAALRSLPFDAAIVATPTATHRDVVLEL